MKMLFAVSECVPFVKSGGLADVAGALPKELARLGMDVRVVLPKFGLIPDTFKDSMEKVSEFTVSVGWRNQYCGVESLEYEGITYYFIDNEYYFKRDSLYGHYDDGERFSFFCRAVLEMLPWIDFQPDILHCHDWHTGMVNFLLNEEYRYFSFYENIKTVFTIHNLQFQGIFPKEILPDILNLSLDYFCSGQLEFYGNINFMKAAILASDIITTVSPTYKNEIQTPYFGEKLDGLLCERSASLTGILNGIDGDLYNPATDNLIKENYDHLQTGGKMVNKKFLQETLGFEVLPSTPVMSMVTRLTKQKGLDLVAHVFEEILQEDIQMIVLGTGDTLYEEFLKAMEARYPKKFKAIIGFNETLAHQIYAGSDLFLMPSMFEPCGLGQLIAMQYGTIPIVRETGGLNDTVQSYNEWDGTGNGFSFSNFNAHDMLYTIRRALQFYKNDEVWNGLVKAAMSRDYSWAQSAFQYYQLYAGLRSGSDQPCSQTKKALSVRS